MSTRNCEWVIRYHTPTSAFSNRTYCTRKATNRYDGIWYCAYHARETKRMMAVANAAYRIAGLAETANVTSSTPALLLAIARLMTLVTKFDIEDTTKCLDAASSDVWRLVAQRIRKKKVATKLST